MFAFIRIHAVEILSIAMGVWLLWIILIYTSYFRALKTDTASKLIGHSEESNLQKAKNKRKETYDMAVTYPSYTIFWIAVIVWGISYLLKNSSL